jgi:hypothetical protein
MCRRRSQPGTALIEMALIFPLVLFLLLGAIHFGYLFYLYNGLEKSVRDGARYAASRTYVYERPTDYRQVVERAVVYGSQQGTAPLVDGLNYGANQVLVELIPDNGTRPQRVRVSIQNYTYQGVLSFIFGNINLSGKPAAEMPFIGLDRNQL